MQAIESPFESISQIDEIIPPIHEDADHNEQLSGESCNIPCESDTSSSFLDMPTASSLSSSDIVIASPPSESSEMTTHSLNEPTSSPSSSSSSAATPQMIAQDMKMEVTRHRVAQEILETEENYGTSLSILVEKYLVPLRRVVDTPKEILTKLQIRTLFYQLEVIRGINTLLLSQLQPRLESWHPLQLIGDIFQNYSEMLRSYSLYINNYSQALLLLEESEQNKNFKQFCRKRKNEWLSTLLIRPVQRIPQYIMLLTSLSQATPPSHPDYLHVTRALQKVKAIAEQNHKSQLQIENTMKLVRLEKQLGVKLLEGYRNFIFSAPVYLWDIKAKKARRRHVFLFNDIFLICEQSDATAIAPAASSHDKLHSSSDGNADRFKIINRFHLIEILRIIRDRSIIRELLPDIAAVASSLSQFHHACEPSAEPVSPETVFRQMCIFSTMWSPLVIFSLQKDQLVSELNMAVAEATDSVRSRDQASLF